MSEEENKEEEVKQDSPSENDQETTPEEKSGIEQGTDAKVETDSDSEPKSADTEESEAESEPAEKPAKKVKAKPEKKAAKTPKADDGTEEKVSDEDSKPEAEPEPAEKPAKKVKAKPEKKAAKTPKADDGSEEKVSDEDSQPEAENKEEKKEETAADLLGANIEQVKIRKAKGSKNISSGICFIVATFNNTKVSFSDMKGNVISWSSSGKCNFRGSRKSTAYAAQVVTQDAGRVAMSHGMKEVLVKVKGPGMGRDSAIRALQSLGFSVTSIIDVTPVPHNGCRPPKRRRV
jgi:small subunit ribosomal protein S11